jgi:hypothetical protein
VRRLYTFKRAAFLLDCSQALLKKLQRQGALQVVRLGRAKGSRSKKSKRLSRTGVGR